MQINNTNFWKDKTIFVTGGAGFIGSHLTRKLTELGAKVCIFVHHKYPEELNPRATLLQGDLSDKNSVDMMRALFETTHPDIVFHLAAQPLVNRERELLFETLDVNIRGTYNLLAACVGVRSIQSIVHISTDKVYGNLDLITEKEIPNGVEHPYNASKLSGDIIAQMFSNTFALPITIIRNGNVYGGGDLHWDRIIPKTMRNVLMGLPPTIRGDGKMLRDYIHVSEMVMGYLNAAEYGWARNTPTILRLGSTISYSVSNVIDSILKVTGKIDVQPVYQDVLRGEIPNQHIFDPTSQALIGWHPTIDLDTGLELTLPFYQDYVRRYSND